MNHTPELLPRLKEKNGIFRYMLNKLVVARRKQLKKRLAKMQFNLTYLKKSSLLKEFGVGKNPTIILHNIFFDTKYG